MGWPQITLLALWTIGLGFHMARHGQPIIQIDGQPARYNFGQAMFARTVWVLLLWLGGFFDRAIS